MAKMQSYSIVFREIKQLISAIQMHLDLGSGYLSLQVTRNFTGRPKKTDQEWSVNLPLNQVSDTTTYA